ncbi:fasciclin domain-containing protein [Modestobacter sp. SSW1-42]|uniref:fasciclin domain-containing protein n=1 Tax=Modestobacter sp. SSW1-42 TaxID=596372 RepID=UPI0039878FAF
MKSNLLTRGAMIAAVSGLALSMSACGGAEDAASSATSAASSAAGGMTSESPSSSSSAPMTSAAADAEPFGPGCALVPADGAGSFAGMTADPVATAASNNPVLSTLVQAVTAAELGDTLNSAQDITVLAPANPAFEAVPADALQALLADKAQLTTVLTHHVIEGRLTPEELAGTHTTLAGDEVTIEGSGEEFTIAGADTVVKAADANVICGNVQTANATVYIIDQVLAPAA